MRVTFSISGKPSGGLSAIATWDAQRAAIESVEDIRDLIRGVGAALTDRQYRGLGVLAALVAVDEFGLRSNVDQLGRWLDSVYVSPPTPAATQAFSTAMGEATFRLRRGDLEFAFNDLAVQSRSDLEG